MVYMGGDNDLADFGQLDLEEMCRADLAGAVHVAVQFDAARVGRARRYLIGDGRSPAASCVDDFPSVNAGAPEALVAFVKWAKARCPSEHDALVLWSHGRGWKDEDIYAIARRVEVTPAQDTLARRFDADRAARPKRCPLFRSTVDQAAASLALPDRRGILYDNGSMDFLDNIELRRALSGVQMILGHRLDVLGLDACLMSMVEVHVQVMDLCDVVVASEEAEPGYGWPYARFLDRLAGRPDASARALGCLIVQAYADAPPAGGSSGLTQAAIQTDHLGPTLRALHGLGRLLCLQLSDRRKATRHLLSVLRQTQSFRDPDFVDIIDLCRRLSNEFGPDSPIGAASMEVVRTLSGATSPIVCSAAIGRSVANAHGMSIYLPTRNASPLYASLEFAKGAWDDFVSAFAA